MDDEDPRATADTRLIRYFCTRMEGSNGRGRSTGRRVGGCDWRLCFFCANGIEGRLVCGVCGLPPHEREDQESEDESDEDEDDDDGDEDEDSDDEKSDEDDEQQAAQTRGRDARSEDDQSYQRGGGRGGRGRGAVR